MPYCYVWSSFALRGLSNKITRVTNGVIEQAISSRKSALKNLRNSNPALYATKVYELVMGKTLFELFVDFQSNIDEFLVDKQPVNESLYESNTQFTTGSKSDQEQVVKFASIDDSNIEQDFVDATENWDKKPHCSSSVKNKGFYQKKTKVDFLQMAKNAKKKGTPT
jgi:hypothetical protein